LPLQIPLIFRKRVDWAFSAERVTLLQGIATRLVLTPDNADDPSLLHNHLPPRKLLTTPLTVVPLGAFPTVRHSLIAHYHTSPKVEEQDKQPYQSPVDYFCSGLDFLRTLGHSLNPGVDSGEIKRGRTLRAAGDVPIPRYVSTSYTLRSTIRVVDASSFTVSFNEVTAAVVLFCAPSMSDNLPLNRHATPMMVTISPT
jgi:hypothetical protein